MAENRSLVITLPEDEARKEKLRRKLEEYKRRLDVFRAPELQIDIICKIAVLEHLLEDGLVDTWDLSRMLAVKYGSGFDSQSFDNACGVIENYVKTSGANLRGGTGLK